MLPVFEATWFNTQFQQEFARKLALTWSKSIKPLRADVVFSDFPVTGVPTGEDVKRTTLATALAVGEPRQGACLDIFGMSQIDRYWASYWASSPCEVKDLVEVNQWIWTLDACT